MQSIELYVLRFNITHLLTSSLIFANASDFSFKFYKVAKDIQRILRYNNEHGRDEVRDYDAIQYQIGEQTTLVSLFRI